MNKEKILIEDFIKNNPFDFKQGIISACRQLDKLDVYEWVAEDELKIQQLQQENKELKEYVKSARSVYEGLLEEVEKLNDKINDRKQMFL